MKSEFALLGASITVKRSHVYMLKIAFICFVLVNAAHDLDGGGRKA